MNAFYHDFSVGFNWWMLFVPISFALMVALGVLQYNIVNLKVRRKFNQRLFGVVAVVLAVIFAAMVFIESVAGIVQMLDNHLVANESPVWSLVFAPLVVFAASAVYGTIAYEIGLISGRARRMMLRSKIKNLLSQTKPGY